jgi:hypothetical protein
LKVIPADEFRLRHPRRTLICETDRKKRSDGKLLEELRYRG